MLRLIADIFGTIGMAFFLIAEIYQLKKIRRTGKCSGLSFTTYRSKILACICTMICFGMTGLLFSFVMIVAETLVILPILWILRLDKPGKIYTEKEFLEEIKKW